MRSIGRSCSLALVAFTALGASSANAGTIYVNANANTGANDGSSWSNAFQGSGGVRSALAVAAHGDQIWVAQGRYLPSSHGIREFSFGVGTGIAMYGGFAGGETDLSQRDVAAHVTILSGDLNGDDASNHFDDNSYHVVAVAGVLDGFTISGGNANGTSLGDHDIGGGIVSFNIGTNAVIAHCIVRDNHAIVSGGGMSIDFANVTITDTRFESNTAGVGGGLSSGATAPIVSRCVFTANTASIGSAIYINTVGYAVTVPPQVFNCRIDGNTTTGGSSAVHILSQSATVADCTIVGNSSHAGPGGIILDDASSALLNSIVYFNTGIQGQVRCDDVRWCCVQGGHTGPGNFDVDPQFVNRAGGDFTLALGSPCIDAGNNNLVPTGTTLDLGLQPRFVDDPSTIDTGVGGPNPIVDMGAYEAPNHLYTSSCAGDTMLATHCPCANFGQAGHGCANSDSLTSGALQAATGGVSPDRVVLNATEMLQSVSCIFLQGDAQDPNGVVFGDGVRCVAGHLLRLGVKHAVGGVASYPETGELSITARSAQLGQPIASGDVRYYQTYYRDPQLDFCPPPQGDSWNVTNAIAVQW